MPRPGLGGGGLPSRLAELVGEESQEAAAARIGVTRATVNRWVNGVRPVQLADAEKVAVAYGVRVAWLLYGDGPKYPDGDTGADAYRAGYLAGLSWAHGQLAGEIMRLQRAADEAGLRDLAQADGADAPP